MAISELLLIISANKDSVAGWRAQEDALREKQHAELEQLREGRKETETRLAVSVLQVVCGMCEAGVNSRFRELYNLVNGLSGREESFDLTIDKTRIVPLVPIKPFFDIAEELSGTTAGAFIRDVFNSFKERMRDMPKDQIRVIGLSSLQDNSERAAGTVMLCDNSQGDTPPDHIGVGFDIVYKTPSGLPQVVVKSVDVLSPDHSSLLRSGPLNDQFDHMLLSEQVIVIGALFVATDRAVTEALLERQAATAN